MPKLQEVLKVILVSKENELIWVAPEGYLELKMALATTFTGLRRVRYNEFEVDIVSSTLTKNKKSRRVTLAIHGFFGFFEPKLRVTVKDGVPTLTVGKRVQK